ncbi:MAG TPA: tRNA (guanosine(46)-N7)-methyltransferase TrmB [Woeseiaceae bacterium]|jgi:tRNA (guanine-N7-)-methyltransferase|nr:tRNA (guanosine(46)-N7)-methyltransferase TrmB [Woeseiaceae bacterium]
MADREDEPGRQRRPIRSFVRRAGRLTASQQRALDELWPRWGVDCAATALDLDALFGRHAPRVLEIGFGNGESLVRQAADHPEQDFIGIEVHEPGVGHCLLAIRDAGISNLRLISHDALDVLTRQIPPASLARINLYFPDPWPKKRHHKRRILQPSFVELCADRLISGGALHIATDWANYAEHIDETMAGSGRFTCDERREHGGDQPLDRPVTKFERRGLRLGHRIWDWRFDRV